MCILSVALSLPAFAAPIPDTHFGIQGVVRIGAPSGFEDVARTSTMLPDSRLIVAGISSGRRSYAFLLRFTTTGALDTTFGDAGTVLLSPPAGYDRVWDITVDALPDGRLILGLQVGLGFTKSTYVMTRLTARGAIDTSFGIGGAIVPDASGFRVALQPDGKLLVLIGSSPGLRFRRFLADGAIDASFGTGGLVDLALPGLSAKGPYGVTQPNLVNVDPGGGFTVIFLPVIWPDSSYMMVRVTSDGALDTNFGNGGYAWSIDLAPPYTDAPGLISRCADGTYVLFGGYFLGDIAVQSVLWKVSSQGTRVAFGQNGHVVFDTGGALTVLAGCAVAVAQRRPNGTIRITVVDANGTPLPSFGAGGSTDVRISGYVSAYPVSIHAASAGGFAVAATAGARLNTASTNTIGNDAVVVAVDASGNARSNFGRGDGIVIWNNVAASNDRIDTLVVDGDGRVGVIGTSDSNGTLDYFASRVLPNGTIDSTFANGGRMNAGLPAQFAGIARAVRHASGGYFVASGNSPQFDGSGRGGTMFRITPTGAIDPSLKPYIYPSGGKSTIGLALRPDGRIVYLTNDISLSIGSGIKYRYVLEQILPDGSADLSFGTNGFAWFNVTKIDYEAMLGDLVILGDGSLVMGGFLGSTIDVVKVNRNGSPATSFGTAGRQTVVTSDITYSPSTNVRVLALADGTIVTIAVAYTGTSFNPSQRFLHIVRYGPNGSVISARRLSIDLASTTFDAIALPDSSIVIGRTTLPSIATLARLLPNDRFDGEFGGDAGSPTGLQAISAFAVDASGALIVGGQDATSAVVVRYLVAVPAADAQPIPTLSHATLLLLASVIGCIAWCEHRRRTGATGDCVNPAQHRTPRLLRSNLVPTSPVGRRVGLNTDGSSHCLRSRCCTRGRQPSSHTDISCQCTRPARTRAASDGPDLRASGDATSSTRSPPAP